MSQSTNFHVTAGVMRFIARAASVFVIAFALFYIFAAMMMISGSDSPVFPKMLFSFAALICITAGLILAWRREAAGAIVTLIGFVGYRLAEWARVGYIQKPTILIFIISTIAVLFLVSVTIRRQFSRGDTS